MIYEALKNSFRVYDNIAKQTRYLKAGEVNNLFGLISPHDGLLPWQMRLSSTNVTITDWKIRKLDDSIAYDLNSFVGTLQLHKTKAGETYILSDGKDVTISMAPGLYYFVIIINGAAYYSEIFNVSDCVTWARINEVPYLVINWDNSCGDLGPLLYQTGWTDIIILDTVIEREEPSIYEEGSEDAVKNFTPFLQKYIDNLNFDAFVPFHMVETLVLMSMHKRISISTPGGLYNGSITNIKTAVTHASENIYTVNVKFQQATLYVNTGCCDKIALDCTPPQMLNKTLPSGTIGEEYNATRIITGSTPIEITVNDKPDWLTVEISGNNLSFTGTPDEEGFFPVDIIIGNFCGADTFQSHLNVEDPDMQAGMIVMWSGAVGSVPGGWALCDGSAGTPDLRGKFIVGYDAADADYNMIGKPGGAKTVALTVAQMPAHSHTMVNYKTETIDANGSGGDQGVTVNGPGLPTSSTGGGQAHENRPPYYTLAYIIKL